LIADAAQRSSGTEWNGLCSVKGGLSGSVLLSADEVGTMTIQRAYQQRQPTNWRWPALHGRGVDNLLHGSMTHD
jgi:hypothetical protein